MPLWHFHSEVLKGFYASEVYVSADDYNSALLKVLLFYDQYVAAMIQEFGTTFLTDSIEGDPEFTAESTSKRMEFRQEAITKLKPIPGDAVFFIRK